jgi:hypothetical protein
MPTIGRRFLRHTERVSNTFLVMATSVLGVCALEFPNRPLWLRCIGGVALASLFVRAAVALWLAYLDPRRLPGHDPGSVGKRFRDTEGRVCDE